MICDLSSRGFTSWETGPFTDLQRLLGVCACLPDPFSFTLTDVINSFSQHIDIRLLPSLVPDDYRNDVAAMIVPELSSRITKLKTLIDDGVVDQDTLNLSQ